MNRARKLVAVAFLAMAVTISHEAASTPLITPYAIQSQVMMEDGYGYSLKVCGEVLCKLEIRTPKGLIKVPSGALSSVKNPNILSAELFITPRDGSYEMINFYIPLFDFSDKEKKRNIIFIQFLDFKLKSIELIGKEVGPG